MANGSRDALLPAELCNLGLLPRREHPDVADVLALQDELRVVRGGGLQPVREVLGEPLEAEMETLDRDLLHVEDEVHRRREAALLPEIGRGAESSVCTSTRAAGTLA